MNNTRLRPRGVPTVRRTGHGLLGLAACLSLGAGSPAFAQPAETEDLHVIESVAACATHSTVPPAASPAPHTGSHAVSVSPPSLTESTLVDLGLFIIDVSQVDAVENTFKIQGLLDLVWCDPRQAFDAAAAGVNEKIYLEQSALRETAETWWPDPDFVNQTEPRETENVVLVVRADGTVNYEEQFVATLKSSFDLRRFPFDRQRLSVEIESFVWTAHTMRFHEEAQKIGFDEAFEIPEWHVLSVDSSVVSRQEVRDRDVFSEFLLEIELQRHPGYYIWKLILPLALLVVASWISFWLTDWLVNRRLGLAFSGVLSVVAFQFVIAGDLPKVSYLTFMDSFLMLSFMMMVLTIGQNTIVSHYYLKERQERAHRVDAVSRWLFPLLYLGGLAGLLALYGIGFSA